MRENCPKQNINKPFGSIGNALLEGSILEPDYCLVKNNKCIKHDPYVVGTTNDFTHEQWSVWREQHIKDNICTYHNIKDCKCWYWTSTQKTYRGEKEQ